jgi:hypothetical protein
MQQKLYQPILQKVILLFIGGSIGSILYYIKTSSDQFPTATAKIDIGVDNQGSRKNHKKYKRNFIFNNETG